MAGVVDRAMPDEQVGRPERDRKLPGHLRVHHRILQLAVFCRQPNSGPALFWGERRPFGELATFSLRQSDCKS